MQKMNVRHITTAGVVGAAYAALSIFGSVFGISYGPIQCRFSEALCVLPFLFPETAWGLFIGCVIANILSPYGLLDIVVGSLATLAAAMLTKRCRSRYVAPLPPIVLNGLLVGGVIAFEQVGFGPAFAAAYLYNAVTVAIGETVACYGLGGLLLWRLPKSRYFRNYIRQR